MYKSFLFLQSDKEDKMARCRICAETEKSRGKFSYQKIIVMQMFVVLFQLSNIQPHARCVYTRKLKVLKKCKMLVNFKIFRA